MNDEADEASADEAADPFGGALPDLGGLLESAQQMMAEAQAAADRVVEGVAGGGQAAVARGEAPVEERNRHPHDEGRAQLGPSEVLVVESCGLLLLVLPVAVLETG